MNISTSRRLSVAAVTLAAGLLGASAALPAGSTRPQTYPAARTAVPPPVPAAASGGAAFEDIAKFISGMPCQGEALKKLQQGKEWKDYAAGLDKSWAELETKRLKFMREWTAAEFSDSRGATKILFYPFGGPDFLTAFVLFPEAETYILVGLEPVGKLPEFGAAGSSRPANYLQNINAALWDFFNKSYFVTKAMSASLAGDKVDGVLPILCLFLKRTGNSITDIKRCEFLDKGDLVEVDVQARTKKTFRPYGVEVDFLPEGATKPRTLLYFSADLSDGAFMPKSKLALYLNSLPFETTFIKSASYLMHYTFFSNIRGFILDKSRFILEDDTGIPYRYFKPEIWDGRLYGDYVKPIELFKNVEQADLKAAYADPAKVRKLPFHLGYHWSTNKDSILYFRKKDAAEAAGTR